MHVSKPVEGQYPPPPFGGYLELVPEGDILQMLQEQEREITELYGSFSDEQSLLRYAEGKWSLKEVLGHIMDTERVMNYRLLIAARGDRTPLPGHPDQLVEGTFFDRRTLESLLQEFHTVREAVLSLLQGLTPEEYENTGIVRGSATSAAALAYFIAGHARHHLNIIRDRYLPLL